MKIMKINRQAILIIMSLLLVCLIVSSCSSKSGMNESTAQDDAVMGGAEPSETDIKGESQSDAGFSSGSIEPEKIITSVHLSLETTEFDSTIENLDNIINKNKGYIENSHISSRNRINNKIFKHAEYTVRIPKDNVNGFTDEIGSVGNVVSQSTSKEDITKQYYDTESRLNLLKVKEERMTALLKKAEKIEDIITIENQLSEIIHQKESLTKNILDMDDKVSYSIVHLDISEVEKLRSDVTTKTTFATRISNTFNDSLYTFKVFMEGFVLVFIYALPFLLIGGLAAFLIFKFIRKRNE